MQELTLYAIPAFVAAMCIEGWLLARRSGVSGYAWRDTAASLSMGFGYMAVNLTLRALTLPFFFLLYEHRLFDLGSGLVVWVALFFAEDLTYYCFHRASHEVRFLWAAHINHHSSERYNLSTALRQSWTTPFTTVLFYWPLPLLGFHPLMMLTMTSVSLLYQFWIHTEGIRRLGPLEQVFNTPSHHRVHHGTNVEYLDRNHGGTLILWDRLFGTFEPEVAPVRYGLTKNIDTFHPLRIAFHEWTALMRDLRREAPLRTKLGWLLAPPGWSPDGSTLTAGQLRAAHATHSPSSLRA